MEGWKTWAGAALVLVGAGFHVFDMEYIAETAYALGASMISIGLGHKIEKMLRMVALGATSAADQLAKMPKEPPKIPAFLLPLLLVGGLLALTACTTYRDLGNDRYQVPVSAQEPTWFGVSNSYSWLDNCNGKQVEGYHYQKLEFSDCSEVPGSFRHAYAPGFGPQIIASIFNMLGMGWIASNVGNNTNTSSSAVSESSSTTIIKGGKH